MQEWTELAKPLSSPEPGSTAAGPTMTWPTVRGEADRAFQRGKELDHFGFPRAASAAYHQAATLYQCFLDMDSYFQHVTKLDKAYVPAILAESLFRLARLNADALGDYKASARLYHLAAAHGRNIAVEFDNFVPVPAGSSLRGMGTSLEATGGSENDDGQRHLEKAVQAYRKSLSMSTDESDEEGHLTSFYLAVALDRLQEPDASETILETLRRHETPISCWVDSLGYVRWHLRNVPEKQLNLHLGTRDMLKLGLDTAMPLILSNRDSGSKKGGQALVCEFGVGAGRSLRMAQEILPLDVRIHGFDTFTGLPQQWGRQPAGWYSTGGWQPRLEGDCAFYKGLFRDTLPRFFQDTVERTDFVAFANIDCKLYTSTMDVLENLHGQLVVGSILVFNSYICHPTWRQDGFRALREACKRFGWKYEYLGFSLTTQQAVVRITQV